MGNSLQKSLYNPPLTFRDCLVDGELDISKYFIYRRRQEENEDAMAMASQIYHEIQCQRKRKLESMCSTAITKRRKQTRSVKRHKILVRNDDGTLDELKPKDTIWYRLYISAPP